MKLKKIVIYGFGKHENKIIDFDTGVNIIYGENEAGKTTIQQFILQVLFGFPQKNSTQLRYEPKSGGKYGGQVHISDVIHGDYVIERVRGKSAGDITVYFADGTEGGEEALKTLLRQYDRASFESVFSFSLLQLQGFEKMDELELSRTLLASGTTGVDSLLRVEKKMEKEMADLFKKTGRNPELNQRLQELKEMESDLKSEQERLSVYSPKLNRIHAIEKELIEKKSASERLRARYKDLGQQIQRLPLKNRKRTIEDRLGQIGQSVFPSDGIRRFEMVSGKLTEMEAKVNGLEKELMTVKERMPNPPDTKTLVAIERLLAREPEWHDWHAISGSLQESQRQSIIKKHQLLDRLGLSEADVILQSDVSIHREELLYDQLQKAAELDRQMGYIDHQLTQLENELREVKKELQYVEKSRPSDEDMRRVEEWPSIRDRLGEAKAYLQLKRTNPLNGNLFVYLLLFVVAFAAIAIGFIEKQWLFSIVGACIAVIVAYLVLGMKKQDGSSKEEEMKQFVAQYAGYEKQMESMFEKVAAYRQHQPRLAEMERTVERKMSGLEAEYEKFGRAKESLGNELSGFFQDYGMTKIPNPGILHEFFSMVRSVQEIERDLQENRARLEEVNEHIQSRMTEALVLIPDLQEETLYDKLRSEFIFLKSEQQSYTTLSDRLEELQMEKREVTEFIGSLRAQQRDLFQEAEVETEEQYYKAYDDYQEAVLLNQHLMDIAAQLSMQGAQADTELAQTEEELKTEIERAERALSEVEEIMDQLVQEKTALKIETEKLLTDDTFQQKQQLFEMKKAEFAELAKQWAVRQVTVEAIKGMMKELKDKKLPEVLHGADRLFRELTGGAYESLTILDNGLFQAIAQNGMRYPIIELSQATKEQAYISLRLSLAMAMEKTAPFPILMDDPFVHFDETRLSRMKTIVENLSEQHQFIYVTCHGKMVEEWTNAKIISASVSEAEKGAVAR